MKSFQRTIIDIIIIAVIVSVIVFLYTKYHETVSTFVFGEKTVGVLIRDIPLIVTIADSPEERAQGLSGISSLPERGGKLFIFDQPGKYGIWMKGMLIPIDIIWIDENREIVHIEEGVNPDSYPTIYTSPIAARFVLELNAFFVRTFKISVGDKVTIPSNYLPNDLRGI